MPRHDGNPGRKPATRRYLSGVRWLIDRLVPPALGEQFRRLFVASAFSNIADGIALAAGPLLIAEQTSSPTLVALSVVLQRLPWFLFGFGAGVIADRFDRKRLVVAGNVIRVGLLVLLAITIVADVVDIGIVLAAMFLIGTAEAFTDIAADTLIPAIVPPEHLGIANARAVLVFHALNMLGGPPIGALLFTVGVFVPFAAQGLLIALAAVIVARMTVPPVEHDGTATPRQDFVDGVRWLRANAPVRTLALTIFVFNLTWGATNAIMVLYATERLGLDEAGFGLFLAIGAVGAILGTTVYGALEARLALGTLMQALLVVETLTHAGYALTSTPIVAFAIGFVAGLQAAVWGTLARAVRQRAVPDALMGRVGSVYVVGVQTGLVIGGLVGGAIGSFFGLAAVFWYACIGSAVFLAVIWTSLPRIAHAGVPEPAT